MTGRRAFIRVDPSILEGIDAALLQEALPSGSGIEFDPLDFLEYLPPLEQEIFWMLWARGKRQEDVARLTFLSQPTISYRFQRTLLKLAYLCLIVTADVEATVEGLTFLKPNERAVLRDLFFFVQQAAVGERHGIRQSSVRWIMLKTLAKLEELEPDDPDRWFNSLALVYLLVKHVDEGIRIRSE